jgi:ABC-2 type transport system permease protein
MSAIFKREFSSYMHNVTGPLFMAALLLFDAIFIFINHLLLQYSDFGYSLSNLQFVLIFTVPVLAMRSVAEDRRNRIDQLLYSLPMSLSQVVIGKYLAMLAVFAIPCGIMATYPLIIGLFGPVNYATAYGALIAFFLLGAALLALCMFISALTESQIIAAVIGVGATLALSVIDTVAIFVPGGSMASFVALLVLVVLLALLLWALTRSVTVTVAAGAVVVGSMTVAYLVAPALYSGLFAKVIRGMSLFGRFANFNYGIFDVATLVYDISFVVFFLYLTYQAMEKKRWS